MIAGASFTSLTYFFKEQMPTYEHECLVCKEEFEDFYSTTAPLPPCPKCGGEAKRLICGTNRGKVELTGAEYAEKIKADTQQLKKDMHRSDKVYANMIGEGRYHQLQTQMDRRRKK